MQPPQDSALDAAAPQSVDWQEDGEAVRFWARSNGIYFSLHGEVKLLPGSRSAARKILELDARVRELEAATTATPEAAERLGLEESPDWPDGPDREPSPQEVWLTEQSVAGATAWLRDALAASIRLTAENRALRERVEQLASDATNPPPILPGQPVHPPRVGPGETHLLDDPVKDHDPVKTPQETPPSSSVGPGGHEMRPTTRICRLCRGFGRTVTVEAVNQDGSLDTSEPAVCMACDGAGTVAIEEEAEPQITAKELSALVCDAAESPPSDTHEWDFKLGAQVGHAIVTTTTYGDADAPDFIVSGLEASAAAGLFYHHATLVFAAEVLRLAREVSRRRLTPAADGPRTAEAPVLGGTGGRE